MTALARRRLATIELGAGSNSVSEICQNSGISRATYYAWKHRYAQGGLAGLRDRETTQSLSPHATAERTVAMLLTLAQQNPLWGCGGLAQQLGKRGIAISSPTVQKILQRRGLGTRAARLAQLELSASLGKIELSPQQRTWVERVNPRFREREHTGAYPGALISHDGGIVATLPGIGAVRMEAVLDSYSSFAFATLTTSASATPAVDLLEREVVPYFRARGAHIEAVVTNAAPRYRGRGRRTYPAALDAERIAHLTVRPPPPNGFSEYFRRVAMSEFFLVALRTKTYVLLAALEADFAAWLRGYNDSRRSAGFPNLGEPPSAVVARYGV